MEDLSLHVLDIVENGVRAGAKRIWIRIEADPSRDELAVEIRDDGCGMTAEEVSKTLDPFYTTKTVRRVGLGIPLLAQAARAAGGGLEIESAPGCGTRLRAEFGLCNIDRPPLGDPAGTLAVLMAGNPGVDFSFVFRAGEDEIEVDTAEIRGEDAEGSWPPELLSGLRERLAGEIERLRSSAGGIA